VGDYAKNIKVAMSDQHMANEESKGVGLETARFRPNERERGEETA